MGGAQARQCTYDVAARDTFTVPPYVSSATFTLYGAGHPFDPAPRYGGKTQGTLGVARGQVFEVNVGGPPHGTADWKNPVHGGFNGGGEAHTGADEPCCSQAGAGASDIRFPDSALSHRLFVAGGAGGQGRGFYHGVLTPIAGGGNGGGLAGDDGTAGSFAADEGRTSSTASGGQGGNQFGGGASPGSGVAQSASLFSGGNGAVAYSGGAGGGGGYYGGGATGYVCDTGCWPGGGGGGSGYVTPLATSASTLTGGQGQLDETDGTGKVVVSWPTPTATIALTSNQPSPVPDGAIMKLRTTVQLSADDYAQGTIRLLDCANGAGNPPCFNLAQNGLQPVDPSDHFKSEFVFTASTASFHAYAGFADHTIVATYEDSEGVVATVSSAPLTLHINQHQTIDFTAPAGPHAVGDPTIALGATATSGLTVAYSVTGPCTVSASTLTLTGAGSCEITAAQAGNGTYYAATPVAQTVTIDAGTPTITWSDPAPITYPTALSSTQLNATASVPGTLTYSPAAGTVLHPGTEALKVTFAPTNSTDYGTATKTVFLTIDKATPTITWDVPAPITYGTALSATQLNAVPSVPGTLNYIPAAGTVLHAGDRGLFVTFVPANQFDYLSTTKTIHIMVNPATPTITWNDPAPITYPTALSGAQLNATASVPGTLAYAPAAGTVLHAGAGQALDVTLAPTSGDYVTTTKTVHITVNPATPTITWNNPAAITYGTALSATQLNATASVAGTLTYSPAAGTVLGAGPNQTLGVTLSPAGADYAPATKTVQITVNKAATTLKALAVVTIGPGLSIGRISATLARTDSGIAVAGKPVSFKTGLLPLCTATTDAAGRATCEFTLTSALRTVLSLGYGATFAGDTNYVGASATAGLLGLGG